jgi:hypothetical protein
MANDMDRFHSGQRTLEKPLEERPEQRTEIVVWQGSGVLYEAVLAREAGRAGDYQRLYKLALQRYAEADRTGSGNPGVCAVQGGSFLYFGDRLAPEHRAAAWHRAWECYNAIAKMQIAMVDQLPLHLKGELLAGLTQSAQRTGHQEEYTRYLAMMADKLGTTPYGPLAKKWQDKPELAATTNLGCKSCHDAGRLESRKAALTKAAER